MPNNTLPSADDVLDFWFGTLNDDGIAEDAVRARWYKKDPAFDVEVKERFEALYKATLAGDVTSLYETARGRLSCIIVLDQLSRNMFRDRAEMYSGDELAAKLTGDGIDAGQDKTLPTDMRVFFYMPLMHAEDVAQQTRCVQCFEQAASEKEGAVRKKLEMNLDYARKHRDIVARFGRFPHRNEILSRESTDEERAFLTEPGSSF